MARNLRGLLMRSFELWKFSALAWSRKRAQVPHRWQALARSTASCCSLPQFGIHSKTELALSTA